MTASIAMQLKSTLAKYVVILENNDMIMNLVRTQGASVKTYDQETLLGMVPPSLCYEILRQLVNKN